MKRYGAIQWDEDLERAQKGDHKWRLEHDYSDYDLFEINDAYYECWECGLLRRYSELKNETLDYEHETCPPNPFHEKWPLEKWLRQREEKAKRIADRSMKVGDIFVRPKIWKRGYYLLSVEITKITNDTIYYEHLFDQYPGFRRTDDERPIEVFNECFTRPTEEQLATINRAIDEQIIKEII